MNWHLAPNKIGFGFPKCSFSWESGREEALSEAAEIAQSMHDEYNRDDPYCQGICDAASGIAWRIRELKK